MKVNILFQPKLTSFLVNVCTDMHMSSTSLEIKELQKEWNQSNYSTYFPEKKENISERNICFV